MATRAAKRPVKAGGDWRGARQTLSEKLRTGELPRSVYRRRDALLALQEAR